MVQPARRAAEWVTSSPDRKYVIVGAATAVLSFSLLSVLVEVAGWHPIPANFVQWLATTYLNFLLVCAWAYPANPFSWSLTKGHFATRLGGLALVQLGFAGLTAAGFHYAFALLISSAAGFSSNFLLASRVVFRTARKKVM